MYLFISVTARRDRYPNSLLISIFSARWVSIFSWIHYCTYYLRLTFFRMDLHLLHPIWCRDFTSWKHVLQRFVLSFFFQNLSICLRRRCYRRFCSSNMIHWFDTMKGSAGVIFRQHVVHFVFKRSRFRIWYFDRSYELSTRRWTR